METKNLENEENVDLNKIIPKFIGKSINLRNEMRKKLLSNSIFNEFDNKASKDFFYYLNQSNKRYKGLKHGGHLNNFIEDTRLKNLKKAEKILSDDFYTKLDLEKDRAAMKINHNGPLFTEMEEMIKLIKENADETLKNKSLNERIRKNDLFEFENKEKETKRLNEYNAEKVFQSKELIREIINDDKENLINDFSNYKDKLNDLRNKCIINGKKIKGYIDFKPDIRMLNYQKYIPVKVEKKVEIPIVDIKKIIPYSKIGKKLGRSVKEIKSRNVKLPFITSQSYEISDYNFKNPYKIIKDLANNESYVEEKFQLKKNLLENYLKTESLPTIETYETIVKEKSKAIKDNREKKNELLAKIQVESLMDKRDISRRKIEDDIVYKWDKLIEKLDKENCDI